MNVMRRHQHEFVIHGLCSDAGYALQFKNNLYLNNEYLDHIDIDFDGESIQALVRVKTTLFQEATREEIKKMVKLITCLDLTVSTRAEVPLCTIFLEE